MAGNEALACAAKFQSDREVVRAAVQEDGSALEYASDSLKRDQEIRFSGSGLGITNDYNT